jgi:hypothetical protein
MSGLRRPTPAKQILDLARRLAEEYVSIPLPEVSRVVHDAATVTEAERDWSGTAEGIPALIEVLEAVAREDLDQIRAEQVSRGEAVTPEPAVARPRATRRNGPRQGAA